ncbi:MAG TPA: phosphotransferase [Planctomycetota bacterium]|nr:phosphotransferase [Planctomycetota bacterium]
MATRSTGTVRPDPSVERLLKRDALGRVELVRDGTGFVVQRVPSRVPVLGTVARLMIRREHRALSALAGLADVPAVVVGARGVARRSWLPGQPLSVARELPRDYFDRLEELVRAMHARGVCHNDLHKEGNILVGDDGRPALIDFQLASLHPRRGRSFGLRAAEDLRQIQKHRSLYCRGMGTESPIDLGLRRPRLLARAWRRLWKPVYNTLMRRSGLRARLSSGEPRRRAGAWPRWVDAVGPRR